ncbi:MAG: WHG domain-containing protein, partial [Candidatus Dormiibacterota bacterium]
YADLLHAVRVRSLAKLREFMERELPPPEEPADPGRQALRQLTATGRGYVLFAVREPGLFDCACCGAVDVRLPRDPLLLLTAALDACVEAGILDRDRRAGAEALAWIGVHGLAVQVLDGIHPARGPGFEALLDRTLLFVARGIGIGPQALGELDRAVGHPE